MLRRRRVIVGSVSAALAGVAIVFASILWLLWQESITSETAYAGGLATSVGQKVDRIFFDTRKMLTDLNQLPVAHCSAEHLKAMQDAAISRPYIRGIGYWQAIKRICGVGLLPSEGLKPEHADRIYPSGVIAWWPSPQTSVGGVQLFLLRYGDHDVALDPRLLLDLGPRPNREAELWVDHLRMASAPWGMRLPPPDTLPIGVSLDSVHSRIISHFADNELLPVDVVAAEPVGDFLGRHSKMLGLAAGLGLLLAIAWIYLILRYSRHRLSLAMELRQALAAGSLEVKYQPVIELASGRCVGSEALARWNRENGEPVSPLVFIPIAEEAGLIQDLTLTVLKIAMDDVRRVRTEFPTVSVNVNLSPEDLRDERTGHALIQSLAASDLSAGAVKLEITERALINSDVSRALIRELRQRGHRVAIDDFGTGYSSLSYLQTFELDVLKIDKSFVDAIGTEAATSQVIVHVIEMAKALNLEIVAEGVETIEQVDWLVTHGVTFGQGFLFGKPLSIGDYVEFLRTQNRHAFAESRREA